MQFHGSVEKGRIDGLRCEATIGHLLRVQLAASSNAREEQFPPVAARDFAKRAVDADVELLCESAVDVKNPRIFGQVIFPVGEREGVFDEGNGELPGGQLTRNACLFGALPICAYRASPLNSFLPPGRGSCRALAQRTSSGSFFLLVPLRPVPALSAFRCE